MLEGIEILVQNEIMQYPAWLNKIMAIVACVVAISFILGIVSVANGWFGVATTVLIIAACGAMSMLILDTCTKKEPSGRYTYQVTIDDNVSVTELYSKYEVIEQNGKIWTIIDKE
jgi:hypothetical protein